MMTRHVLDESQIHPAVRDRISQLNRDLVEEVQAQIRAHDVVIVGMSQNPAPRRARKLLAAKNIPFHYMEYGSYLSLWRRRTALKMWTGWPTFPMIWVKGTFVGGCDDMEKLLESGELEKLLKA
jgi:glutaredoxin-related protein